MKLFLVRHGESVHNHSHICSGRIDCPLSLTGKLQVSEVAEKLKGESIDLIISSDLQRARDTAIAIAKFHECEVFTDELLRERNFGPNEGKPFPKSWDWTRLPEEVESDEAICCRVAEFLTKLGKHKNKNILVASHAGVMMALLTILNEQDSSEFYKYEGIKNTEVKIIEHIPEKFLNHTH
jgi:broad specificity phosphatase PhoE